MYTSTLVLTNQDIDPNIGINCCAETQIKTLIGEYYKLVFFFWNKVRKWFKD